MWIRRSGVRGLGTTRSIAQIFLRAVFDIKGRQARVRAHGCNTYFLRQTFQASVEVRLKRLISTAVEMRLKFCRSTAGVVLKFFQPRG